MDILNIFSSSNKNMSTDMDNDSSERNLSIRSNANVSTRNIKSSRYSLKSERTNDNINLYFPITVRETGSDTVKSDIMTEQKLKFPFFSDCLQYIEDPLWVSIFIEAAKGKLLKGFIYSDGQLMFMRRGASASKKTKIILSSDISLAAIETLNFFRNKSNIKSNIDRINEKNIIQNATIDKSLLSKNKKMRNILINDYIYQISKEVNYSSSKTTKFAKFVRKYFALGVLKPKHIIVNRNKIDYIEKLYVDEDGFYIDSKVLASYYKSKTTINYVSMEQFISLENTIGENLKPISFRKDWEKYLKPIETEVNQISKVSLAKKAKKNRPIASTIDQIEINILNDDPLKGDPLKIDFEMTGPSALS